MIAKDNVTIGIEWPFFSARPMLVCVMSPLIYSHGTMKTSKLTVPCWVCDGTLSRQAKVCPHCGHPEPADELIKRFEQLRQQELKNAASRDTYQRKESAFSGLLSGIFVVSMLVAIWLFIF